MVVRIANFSFICLLECNFQLSIFNSHMVFTLDSFKNTDLKIHIVGAAAVEGAAIARFLGKMGAKNIVLHDFCEQKDFAKRFLTFHNGVKNRGELWQAMKKLPYQFRFAEQYLQDIEQADLIFLNQAWYKYDFNFPKLGGIVDAGKIPVSCMVDLYLQLFPGKIIGVTGTHGKTTVTRLLGHVLNDNQVKAYVSGNDRHSDQILDHLHDLSQFSPKDWLVLEISNRQLKQRYSKGPDIAIITNIYPNHLDEHPSLDEYRLTKERIADNQPDHSYLIVGDNDPELVKWANSRGGKVIDSEYKKLLQAQTQFPSTLLGEHNVANVAFVDCVCNILGLSRAQLQASLMSFKGVEKRMQRIYQDSSVIVINDLASTTPQATLAAVKTYQGYPLIVILGGDDKDIPQANWQLLQDGLEQAKVILLPGTINQKLVLPDAITVSTWAEALIATQKQVAALSGHNQKETIVLLSPSGEGFYTALLQGVNLQKEIEAIFAPQSV